MTHFYTLVTILVTLFTTSAQAHVEGLLADQTRPVFMECTADDRFPIATQYLKDHVRQLFLGSAHLFPKFASSPDALCVHAEYNPGSYRPNAAASPDSGEIIFAPSFLRLIESEDQLAAVLAHELSHVMMYHSTREPIPFFFRSRATPKVLSQLREVYSLRNELSEARNNRNAVVDSYFQAIRSAIANDPDTERKIENRKTVQKYESFSTIRWADHNAYTHPFLVDDGIYSQFIELGSVYKIETPVPLAEYHSKILNLISKIDKKERPLISHYGSAYKPELFTNFREREADEVGLEMFIRAGYNPESYGDSVLVILMLTHPELKNIEAARSYCKNEANLGKVRLGDDSHPSLCWRVLNIARELEIHHDYYQQLPKTLSKKSSSNSLAEVKSYLLDK